MRFQDTHKVVAANAGIGGPVVYLTEDDDWTLDLHEAELIEDEAHAQIRMLSPTNPSISVRDVRLQDVCRVPNGPALVLEPRPGR